MTAGEGEFEFIRRALAPLCDGEPGAYGLKDDGAVLAPEAGEAFAFTSDTLVEGVHFPEGDDPFNAGWKALAANVSDLTAMGARPRAYLLNVVWPRGGPQSRADRFVEGLAAAQADFGCRLAGGDTTRASGPWTLSITAIGAVAPGATPRRGGARPGDVLVLTNTIGDAWLGLQAHQGAVDIEDPVHRQAVDAAFLRPRPPVALASLLASEANAAVDVSDGLLADTGHILRASGLAGDIALLDVPLSDAAHAWLALQADPVEARVRLVCGGDDYQIVAAVPAGAANRFLAACAELGHPAAVIGHVSAGEGLTVTANGEPVAFGKGGFTHF